MKIGLLVAPNERSANPAEVARAAEALGFESLWVPDHSVMPVHTATPLPETRPGEGGIPEIYYTSAIRSWRWRWWRLPPRA
jgi:alkanesulfonate monooxygenase SsuD/methylene tetrahydromethanopterin reductase-like flavin-dependent oxidoreductase (luciferase family)